MQIVDASWVASPSTEAQLTQALDFAACCAAVTVSRPGADPPTREHISMGQYQNEHTKQWADKIASFDGFVFVTPEYSHSTSGVLKNAIDYLYAEWNNKAVGFVSYGGVGGARAAEHLRLVAGELQMADVRQQVALSLLTEFENFSVLSRATTA
jgi:NAD(P)H-dependent FMN reductase